MIGLFGKLPAKRDFVAEDAPGEFLSVWEAWLQGGMTASKMALDRDWMPSYMSAPLWRFRLGPEVCGLPVVGAFTPSIDGVGRHYPLTIVDCGAADDEFPPAGDVRAAPWFEEVESRLLSALEPDLDYGAFLAELRRMPLSPREPAPRADPAVRAAREALFAPAGGSGGFPEAFEAAEAERRRVRERKTCRFWTIGGEGFPEQAAYAEALPDAYLFDKFLTGGIALQPKAEG